MRFQRMVIEAGPNLFTLDLHPRLTVIGGLGRLERESLVGELVGALGASRAGVHTELVESTGRRLAVFRPEGGRHCVVDIDEARDVTGEFRGDDGGIDLLARSGLDMRSARRSLRFSAADLTTDVRGDELIRRLAQLDQAELWSAAARVRVTDDALQGEAGAVGSAPEDAEIVARIEERHQAFESAVARHSTLRTRAVFVGTASLLIGLPAAFTDFLAALPIFAIGVVTTLLALLYKGRVSGAGDAERAALEEAGADSYLGFHLQRVNGLLQTGSNRKRVVAAAEDHREAAVAWRAVAGDVGVDWALEHQDDITAAARVRADMRSLVTMSATSPDATGETTTDIAHVLIARLTHLRHLGTGGEGFPLLLDEPFDALDRSVKPPLLELLGRTAGKTQVIILTDDEDIASWARLEALTGELALLEPTPEHQPDLAVTPARQPDAHFAA